MERKLKYGAKATVPEAGVQRAIISYCEMVLRGWVLRQNVGGMKRGERYIRFAEKGRPDLCVLLPWGRVLWIEVKSAIGKLSVEQKAWHKRAAELGHLVLVARRLDDLVNFMAKSEGCYR
jgi:hypothetical protein